MKVRYQNYTDMVKTINYLDLIPAFVKCNDIKFIIIKNVKLFNEKGQIDVGCCLCGDFADNSNYSDGLIKDFIITTNNPYEKLIRINNDVRRLTFYFKDYKGEYIKEDSGYYYLIELELCYDDEATKKVININEEKNE